MVGNMLISSPNISFNFFADNFNVAHQKSKQNFFANYSIQGKSNPRSYMYQMKSKGIRYSFIGIDACLEPGTYNKLFKKIKH